MLFSIRPIVLLFFCLLLLTTNSKAQAKLDDKEVKVVMRVIGHKILLHTGDSTSRVLPITKENRRYKIEFEKAFKIDPFDLACIVDTILKDNRLISRYRVEVEKCENHYVAHSYELNDTLKPNEIACRGRILPLGCYYVYITFLETLSMEDLSASAEIHSPKEVGPDSKQSKILIVIVLSIPLILFIGLFFHYRRKRGNANSNLITIGKFEFDKRNQTLQHISTRIDLSSKETDLLYLLYSSENTVIKREDILNAVWGDEGDYVGRTLDVFISKLRKKLAPDPRLKIINVHGVGYKFIVNE